MTVHAYVSARSAPSLLVAAALATAIGHTAATSHAQPNPFDDYEQGRNAAEPAPADPNAPNGEPPANEPPTSEPPTSEPPANEPAANEPAALPVEPRAGIDEPAEPEPIGYRSSQHTWGLGGVLQLGYIGGSNESLSGESDGLHGLLFAIAPRGSFFAADNFEVSLATGYLSTLSGRSGGDRGISHSFFFEAGGHYHIAIADTGLALVPGAGIGGQFGSTSRRFVDDLGQETNSSASTMGLLLAGYLTAAYQLAPTIRIRSGISVTGIVARDHLESGERLAMSRAFIGLPVEVTYVF